LIKKITPLEILMQLQSLRLPKGNTFRKHVIRCTDIKIGPTVIYTAPSFTQPQNYMLYNAFQSTRRPKGPLPVGAYNPI